MELALKNADESGWRGRGAPRRKCPENLLRALSRAAQTGKVGVINTDGDTDEDVRDVLGALRAGGRELGRRLTIQRDDDAGEIRFRVGGTL